MRYAYHFEFCERPELPEWLRGDVFSALAWVEGFYGLGAILGNKLPALVRSSGSRRVVELGSGSGEGLATLARALGPASIECVATDLFPRPEHWRATFGPTPGVSWDARPVAFSDFDRVLDRELLEGSVVLLTSAFHHVPASEARSFLERAAAARAQVCVVEPLERSWLGAAMGAAAGVTAAAFPLVALLSGRVSFSPSGLSRWLRLVASHWLVPVIPLMIFHDGITSALRQRTSDDWQGLIQGLPFRLNSHDKLGFFGNFSVTLLTHA